MPAWVKTLQPKARQCPLTPEGEVADQGGRLLPRYLLYGACQMVLVAPASAAVGWLDAKGWWLMVAKVTILPVTFGCNFLIMKLLVALARSRTCAALPS